jgi:hypothetical protein
MTRTLIAVALSLVLAVPIEAAARQGGGGGGGRGGGGGSGGGGRSLSFPRGGGWHGGHGGQGGHHGHHHGSSTFFFGSFGPYWYPGWGWPYRPYYPYYGYYYPYWGGYPYSYYPPPPNYPPAPYRVEDDEYPDVPEASAPPVDEAPASYGLIRLDGVPNGAAVELDGRFWLTADDLDDRWMALPAGEHRIAVTVGDAEPLVRTIRIVPGRSHVLKFDARARRLN